jgi:DNA-binding XRE family transcriptional regulator
VPTISQRYFGDRQGTNRRELAERSDVGADAIKVSEHSGVESGLRTVQKLARTFNVTTDQLFKAEEHDG